MEEFDDVTIEHPGDRIANADDENGIFTDWSKEYEAESIVSDEIMTFLVFCNTHITTKNKPESSRSCKASLQIWDTN